MKQAVYLECIKTHKMSKGFVNIKNEDHSIMIVDCLLYKLIDPQRNIWKNSLTNQKYYAYFGPTQERILKKHTRKCVSRYHFVAIRRFDLGIYYGQVTFVSEDAKIMELDGYPFVKKTYNMYQDVQGRLWKIAIGSTIGFAVFSIRNYLESNVETFLKGSIFDLHPTVRCTCCYCPIVSY